MTSFLPTTQPPTEGVLRRLAHRPPPSAPGEVCEMCNAPVLERHRHVVDSQGRSLMCVCTACYLLFTPDGASQGRYLAVPDRVVDLGPGTITAQQWDQLQIPVSIAFFFHNSQQDEIVALYPGGAGPTESQLGFDTWDDLVASVPGLETMAPDVEALLVRSTRDAPVTAHVVPIDRCYELTGALRKVWSGIEGGPEARRLIEDFFDELNSGRRR